MIYVSFYRCGGDTAVCGMFCVLEGQKANGSIVNAAVTAINVIGDLVALFVTWRKTYATFKSQNGVLRGPSLMRVMLYNGAYPRLGSSAPDFNVIAKQGAFTSCKSIQWTSPLAPSPFSSDAANSRVITGMNILNLILYQVRPSSVVRRRRPTS